MAFLLQLVDRVVSAKFEFNDDVITIGRNPDNTIVIDDMSVSGLHGKFLRENDPYYEGHHRYYLQDMGSTNGSMVNNQPVERVELKNNDNVKIGWIEFKFIGDDFQQHEATAHILKDL